MGSSFFFFSFFFWWNWGLNSGLQLAKHALYCLSHTSSPFFSDYFGHGVLGTFFLGWPRAVILLISVGLQM
jgi:hypothetical protein